MRKIYFRADGGIEIGLGHIVRLIALVEMLKVDFNCIFLVQEPSKEIINLIKETCNEYIILPKCRNEDLVEKELPAILNSVLPGNILVLDGYHFPLDYQKSIKEGGIKLVCIDDLFKEHFYADIVINHTPGIKASSYSVEPYTKLLLGPEYVLLRPPFLLKQSEELNKNKCIELMLISMGGSDKNNYTPKILKECIMNNLSKNYAVLIGNAYRFLEDLKEIRKEYNNIEVFENLNATDVSELMRKAGRAVCSASSVALEYASIGGELFLYQTAQNQKNIYNYFVDNCLAFPFHPEYFNRDFTTIVEKQKHVFDKGSKDRLLSEFNILSNA